MGEISDKIKGKAKQVEGVVTGDKALQREGERDETKGKIKGVVHQAEVAIHKAADAVKNAVKKI